MDQRLSGYNDSVVSASVELDTNGAPLGLDAGDSADPGAACPGCGMTRRELYAEGRMGCAECYRVFEAEVVHALREIHGAVRHVDTA
jgi:protein-arginine kinase activator protein McsA